MCESEFSESSGSQMHLGLTSLKKVIFASCENQKFDTRLIKKI